MGNEKSALLLWIAVVGACGSGPPLPARYVGAESCAACHAKEWNDWRGSHHDRSMQPAAKSTVQGSFAGETFESAALWARFRRDDAGYVIDTREAGVTRSHRVAYTFGVEPLQQYLIDAGGGRLQAFTFAWDTRRRRWFDLQLGRGPPPGDPFHFGGRYFTWNAMCADCHSTGVRKNYDPTTDRYATTFAAVNVGCQSCHGPGSRHVEWAMRPAGARPADRGLVGGARPASAAAEIETCAPCHARRSRVAAEPAPGAPLSDNY